MVDPPPRMVGGQTARHIMGGLIGSLDGFKMRCHTPSQHGLNGVKWDYAQMVV